MLQSTRVFHKVRPSSVTNQAAFFVIIIDITSQSRSSFTAKLLKQEPSIVKNALNYSICSEPP